MNIDELKSYVDINYTDADKVEYYSIPSDVVNDQIDKRIKVALELRESKAGKSPFKRWFYLGKGKDKFDNIYCRRTPYDKARLRAFYKWRKHSEIKGVTIKRFYFGTDNKEKTYKLHRYYKYQYDKLLYKIEGLFEWHPNITLWDMNDYLDALVIKLTMLGVYHGAGFSHILHKKEQMHNIWYARKLLIEAINAEDYFYYVKNEAFKKKFNIDWNFTENLVYYSPEYYIKTGKVEHNPKYTDNGMFLNPTLINTNMYEYAIDKVKEMEDYWHDLCHENKEKDFSYIGAFMKIKMRKAFEYIEQNIFNWGD